MMTSEQLDALEHWVLTLLTTHTESEYVRRGNMERSENTGDEYVEDLSDALYHPVSVEARRALEKALGIAL